MEVFVTIETFSGVIEEVLTFPSRAQAEAHEQKWLEESGMPDPEQREHLSEECTEFRIFQCSLAL